MQQRVSTIKLGENRGRPRVYLEGQWLARAGFTPGESITARFGDGKVVIFLDRDGDRTVSGKQNGERSVIDINCTELGAALASAATLQVTAGEQSITITPAHTEMLVRSRSLNDKEASLFSGGGLLSEAARQAGFKPAMAVEVDPDYAAVYERNHPGARMFNCSVEQVPWQAMRDAGPVGLLTMGIPCEPYANCRKRDRSVAPESHEHGDMTFWALRAVEALNPHTIVVEQAKEYLASASWFVLNHVLGRLGYNVGGRVIDPVEYGELTGRKRSVIVATTGRPIVWPEPVVGDRILADILDPIGGDWFDRDRKPWLFNHWDKQKAKGNGFDGEAYPITAKRFGTIKRRYFAGQGDNPLVAHPTKPGVMRWMTIDEVKRLHGLPTDYYVGDTKTLAGEVMGQGVVVSLFRRIIESVTGRTRVLGRCKAG